MPQLMPALRLAKGKQPRKIGAYDTEGFLDNTACPASKNWFKNTTAFATTMTETKTYGRDHNLFDNNGRMSDKESLYIFGLSAKIDFYAQNLFNDVLVPDVYDKVRQIWGIGHVEISFVRNELGIFQLRDVPLQIPVPVEFHEDTNTDMFIFNIAQPGMLNLTIGAGAGPRMPYLIGPNEQFEVLVKFTAATLPTLGAGDLDVYITLKFEGIRAIEDA